MFKERYPKKTEKKIIQAPIDIKGHPFCVIQFIPILL